MNKDISIIRALAKDYYDHAREGVNLKRRDLHRQVNDLTSERPVVLINELPWVEMNFNGDLTLHCKDPRLRSYEAYMRRQLFQYKYFPCDMILTPYLSIHKIIKESAIGIGIEEEIIAQSDGNHIVSHDYHDQLANTRDLHKIIMPKIEYDKASTLDNYNFIGSILGDILPVKIKGLNYFNVVTWDDISRYRGVTPLLLDLIDRPDHTHKIMRRLTDIAVHRLESYEALGLFDTDPTDLHCTPIENSTLHPLSEKGPVTRRHIWGRGAAQILASVSGPMRDEFDITYMQETIGQCGLSYYGCCEPLDKMIDVVEQLPNLRKISITPWANIDIAAEAIGSRYVLSSKPNPASVAVPHLDEKNLRKELLKILDAGRRHHCHMDLVLKDISSAHHNPQNIIKWSEIAMDLVTNY